jgi:MTH538 TIR-like domain (DUF1863)
MARRVFYSFDYDYDHWRTQQIRNIQAIDGNGSRHVDPNKWETIRSREGIKRWINKEIQRVSCVVVLIGERTADRPWIDYEIERAWKTGKGLVGVRIHGLRDRRGEYSWSGGVNPFDNFSLNNGTTLSEIVNTYDPASWTWDSKTVYARIKDNLVDWIEEAIEIRSSR